MKCKFYRPCVWNPASGGYKLEINWEKKMVSQFANMTSSSTLLDIVMLLLSSLVTGPSFVPMPWLILEWAILIYKRLAMSGSCSISGDWSKLQILNLAGMSLIKIFWMLWNVRVAAFTVYKLLRQSQQGEGVKPHSD